MACVVVNATAERSCFTYVDAMKLAVVHQNPKVDAWNTAKGTFCLTQLCGIPQLRVTEYSVITLLKPLGMLMREG